MKHFLTIILSLIATCNVFSQSITYPDSSVLSSGKWYSVSISTDGIYKLTYNDFVSLGAKPDEINFDKISIFGNTGKQIPEINAEYTNSDLTENAIYVNKENKYVLFYAEATTRRIYRSNDSTFSFSMHPYADNTKYFITFDANIGKKKRIQNREDIGQAFDTTLSSSRDFIYHKRELNNVLQSGRNWVGENFTTTSSSAAIPLNLPNLDINYPIKLYISVFSKSTIGSKFGITINSTSLGNINVPSNVSEEGAREGILSQNINLSSSSNTMNLTYTTANTAPGWLNYVLMNYQKQLAFNNNYLRFFSTDFLNSQKHIKYIVNNVRTSSYMVWDITNSTNVQNINDVNYENNQISFIVPCDTVRTIVVVAGTSFPTPTLNDSVINQNLHGLSAADFIIISPKQFIKQADTLAQIHRDYDKIKVHVIDIDAIYNEFSSGTKDFLAIREFARMMYNKYKATNQQPKNILLFGDGTFDNKNILKYNNNFLPTYQSEASFSGSGDSFTSDDVLACLSDYSKNKTNDTLLVGVGRLPIDNEQDAINIINKIRRYISRQDLKSNEDGQWRNAVMLSSDDADNIGELYFIRNAENIYYQIDETNPGLNVQKAYSDAYKEYTSSSGATYPDASKAINERMNKGCLLFNYLGHGSYDHLSGERLITITDITSWNNPNKLPLMITSTCEFARYDLVDKQSAGEFIVSTPNGGGIALIAASRKISSNDGINRNLHRFALEKKADGTNYTFGEVMQNAKNNTALLTSERSISLIGDPALRISLPKYNIKTTQINQKDIDSTFSQSDMDTITALSNMSIKGIITDFKGNKITNFNGQVQITLYDKKSTYLTLDNEHLGTNLQFEQQNNILHKGYAKVVNGEFAHSFTIPKDISYNYGLGKISYYAQDDTIDASGYSKDFYIGGIDTNIVLKESRPKVSLFLNDSNFVSGGISDENPSLFAVIYDTIPINIVGTGLGHDIVARLDNAENTFILNDYYVYDDNDLNRGYITYPFSNLSVGQHTLTLKVWNIYNFSSEATITFNVNKSGKATYETMNYPNPFYNSTNIVVKYNQPKTITSARLKIFNQQGKIIKDIDATPYINYYTVGPIQWDGTIDGGKKLSNGIYFYSMLLKTEDGDEIIKGQKMVILNNQK